MTAISGGTVFSEIETEGDGPVGLVALIDTAPGKKPFPAVEVLRRSPPLLNSLSAK